MSGSGVILDADGVYGYKMYVFLLWSHGLFVEGRVMLQKDDVAAAGGGSMSLRFLSRVEKWATERKYVM